ncbi:hypothetical protein ACFV0C_03575 [Streptomyces sp. NPDC059568]|uniref:hypothetical protein n=1 Tax=Streptomyces sp. NPDC059568 TaxID=3346868 RepID=UPI003699B523
MGLMEAHGDLADLADSLAVLSSRYNEIQLKVTAASGTENAEAVATPDQINSGHAGALARPTESMRQFCERTQTVDKRSHQGWSRGGPAQRVRLPDRRRH